MGNFAYFKPNTGLWDDWVATHSSAQGRKILIGGKTSWDMFGKDEIDAGYPGFTTVVDLLNEIGCDDHFITEVLKFCIVQTDDVDLDVIPNHPGRLERIKSAHAIGLSGKELVPLLDSPAGAVPSTLLPDDIGFTSHI